MKRWWPLVSTSIALLALALVVVQTFRVRKLERAVQRAQRTARDAADQEETDAELARRLAALEERLDGIGRRAAPTKTVAGSAAAPPADRDLDTDGLPTGVDLNSEEGKQRLKELLTQSRKDNRKKRQQRWLKIASQLQTEQLRALAAKTGISPAQLERLEQITGDEREQLAGLFKAFKSGEKDVSTALDEASRLRSANDDKAQGLLSASQYEAFQEQRKNDRIGKFLAQYGR